MKNRILLSALAIFAVGLLAPANVRAGDEPEPGVGRVSVINGDVSTMRGDSGEWVAATVNAPVVAGDKVATAAHSRAEVQLDFANVMRLDQTAEVTLADLSGKKMQVQVSTGLVDFVVFKGTEAEVEIDTPNMAIRPLEDGVYRIQVDSAGETHLTVRQGEAEVSTPQGSTKVERDQVINVRGTDNPEYRVETAEARDEWDRWNNDRDKQMEQAQAWQHTDRYYTGASDLDAHGQWTEVPGYDWCWTPNVDMGWVPYSDGRWTWEPYWGWTWVSYEPWGWAPYHYGRWISYGSSWYWWPGRGFYGPRPIWAPAYVSFFGFGGRGWGVGVGFGFGSIGWLPMGPRDSFSPWWGRGHSFNVVNITNINNGRAGGFGHPMRGPIGSNLQAVMTDAHVRGALSTVSAQNFVNGRVAHNIQPANENMLRSGSMVKGTLPVVPTRASLQPGTRGVSHSALASGAASNQHFFSRSGAPATRTASFSSEAGQIRNMVQRGPTAGAGREVQAGQNGMRTGNQTAAGSRGDLNAQNPGGRTNVTGRTGAQSQAGVGAAGSRTMGAPAQSANAGWQRFASGSQVGRTSAGINSTGTAGFQRNATGPQGTQARQAGPASQGTQGGWQKFASHGAPSTGRTGFSSAGAPSSMGARATESGGANPRGGQAGWQRFSSHAQAPTGGGGSQYSSRSSGGWSSAAPRSSGGSYGSSRPPLQLSRPLVRERSSGGGYYGGSGRTYSAPSGGRTYSAPSGGRTYSAPSGGGNRSYSAPSGGGHSSYSAPRGGGGGGGGRASGGRR